MSQECPHCDALLFGKEKDTSLCCHKGKVHLTHLSIPDPLRLLITNNDEVTRNYLDHVRQYNSALAFASFGANIVSPPGHGPYSFRIHGQIYHQVAGLAPVPGKQPKYASLYFLDSEQAVIERHRQASNTGCQSNTMILLHDMLRYCNPYAHIYHHMTELSRNGPSVNDVSVTFLRSDSSDPRRYNDPRTGEVAAVFVGPDGEPPVNIDVRVYSRNQPPSKIPAISQHCDPMVYPLLFPCGESGWHPGMMHQLGRRTATRTKLTLLQVRPFFAGTSEGSLFPEFRCFL